MKIKTHNTTAYFVFKVKVPCNFLLDFLGFERCSYGGVDNAYAFDFGF